GCARDLLCDRLLSKVSPRAGAPVADRSRRIARRAQRVEAADDGENTTATRMTCSSFDPLVGFGAANIVALSAAVLVRRGRMTLVDQRGFAVGEVVKYGGNIFFALAFGYVAMTPCYPMPVAQGPAPVLLAVGAVPRGP